MISEDSKKNTGVFFGFWAQAILLIALTLIAFYPAVNAGFIWDDSGVTENSLLFNGSGLLKIWTAPSLLPHEAHYWPVVYTSFWLDYQAWGLNPLGYHLVNILLHTLNVILLFILVRRLYAPAAWLAAAIFALHPLHVESVAWVIERKDVLSTAFYLIAFLLFMNFIEKKNISYYLAAVFLFVMAMLTKSMTASLPVALMLWLWWRAGAKPEKSMRKHYFLLIPFFFVSLGIGLADSIYAHASNPVSLGLTFPEKIIIAGQAFWFYLLKFVQPLSLIPIYSRWEIGAVNPQQYITWLVAVLILISLWTLKSVTGRGVIALFLFYVISIAPVSGIIEHHFMVHSYVADRFFYLPGIGPIILTAVLLRVILSQSAVLKKYIYPAIVTLLVLAMGLLTWKQAALYKNMETLFTYNIKVNPAAWAAYNNLGVFAMENGDYEKAEINFKEAAGLKPDNEDAFINLGFLETERGRLEEALVLLKKALKINPDNPKAHNNIGTVYARNSDLETAGKHLRRAVELRPAYADALNNLGNVLKFSGKTDEAMAFYQQAIAVNPNFADPHYNLGVIFGERNMNEEAVGFYLAAISIDPGYTNALFNLGLIYARDGRAEEAMLFLSNVLQLEPGFIKARLNLADILRLWEEWERAEDILLEGLSLNPDSALLYNSLAHVYEVQGKTAEAFEAYKKALKAAPDWVVPADRLAWIMSGDANSGFHDPSKAVMISEDICRATKHNNPVFLRTLARAYAAAGRREDAVKTVEQGLSVLDSVDNKDEELMAGLRDDLNSYRNK